MRILSGIKIINWCYDINGDDDDDENNDGDGEDDVLDKVYSVDEDVDSVIEDNEDDNNDRMVEQVGNCEDNKDDAGVYEVADDDEDAAAAPHRKQTPCFSHQYNKKCTSVNKE